MSGLLDRFDEVTDPLEFGKLLAASLERNILAEWHFHVLLAATLLLGVIFDFLRNRSILRRYGSRGFRVDATYAMLDMLHVPHFLVIMPLGLVFTRFLEENAAWLRVESLAMLPSWLQLLLLFAATDFWVYWYHRLQHQMPILWQFHKTHHSQAELTVLTAFRVPVLDRIVSLLVLSIPPAIMSVDYAMPLAIVALLQLHQLLLHSGTGLAFGRLGHLLVSPSFHEVHHSTAPRHLDRNFGAVLTVWDHLFGSYAVRGDSELQYGLVHEQVPESYVGQIFVPLRGLYGLLMARRGRGRSGLA